MQNAYDHILQFSWKPNQNKKKKKIKLNLKKMYRSFVLNKRQRNPNGQSRDTDTIGHTRHRTKSKGQSIIDNQETLTPLGTQDVERRQRDNQEWTIKRY